MALHTDTCADRHPCTNTDLLPPQNLQTAALQHSLAAVSEAREGCGRILLHLPAPTALLWFNFVAKASPRQAPAHHVMMYCASDNSKQSCGLPEERYRQCYIPNITGGRVWNWFRHSLGLIGCSLAFFNCQYWHGLKWSEMLTANGQYFCLLVGF